MLTDTSIRAAKPVPKPQKTLRRKGALPRRHAHGRAPVAIQVPVPQTCPLRKEMLLALGSYPEISLKAARDRRDEARRDLANGIDRS